MRNVLAWLLIAWAIFTCVICLLIVASAAHIRSRINRMPWPGRAENREAARAALRDRRHLLVREAPIERCVPRPLEQTPGKPRHLTVVV